MEFKKLNEEEILINKKKYKIIKFPVPHILVDSRKEIHGWYEGIFPYGRRECTSERLLINPYNGCSNSCFYCYANSYWGYMEIFLEEGIITVFKDFDKIVASQLDKIKVASCGYLSPITDPFQKINNYYKLSEKIIEEFIKRNLPIEFITKCVIPEEVIEILKKQEHSFAQISILTLDEELRKTLMKEGATTEELLNNFKKLKGIYKVARIDPIFPHLTDNLNEIKKLLSVLKDLEVNHIIASCLDIPVKISSYFYKNLAKIDKTLVKKYKNLYTERIGYLLNANKEYRIKLFEKLKKITSSFNLTFALCMEYILTNKYFKKRRIVEGLNKYFSTSLNCEGINVPIYVKKKGRFQPLPCPGNCLNCKDLICKIPDLQKGLPLRLKDYKKFSIFVSSLSQLKLNI
jgi:DNA repair photolyase